VHVSRSNVKTYCQDGGRDIWSSSRPFLRSHTTYFESWVSWLLSRDPDVWIDLLVLSATVPPPNLYCITAILSSVTTHILPELCEAPGDLVAWPFNLNKAPQVLHTTEQRQTKFKLSATFHCWVSNSAGSYLGRLWRSPVRTGPYGRDRRTKMRRPNATTCVERRITNYEGQCL